MGRSDAPVSRGMSVSIKKMHGLIHIWIVGTPHQVIPPF